MASVIPPGPAMSVARGRTIPLLCTVCPDTPQFSDVSHLLTHIASKGHLHHETQTRLKSHQEISASLALQRYEHWYKENDIETLLVDRLKAKQIKEAARRKRARSNGPTLSSKAPKRKPKRPTDEPMSEPKIKTEEDILPNLPPFPGHLQSLDNDTDDFFNNSDALSLKGQVWPGMGKMDLANEEMKRTRNQRKPKSVIDRMRRISEGIEPTQVIMTPELEVERVKDVYDETSSPIPGQEESTPPRKLAKPKRKRSEPLSDISVNIQRGNRGRDAHNHIHLVEKTSKLKTISDHDQKAVSKLTTALGSLQRGRVLFPEDDVMPSPFDDSIYNSQTHRDYKLGIREGLGIRTLNPIAQANLVSPILNSKNTHGHNHSRDSHRGRCQDQLFAGHNGLSSLGTGDTTFSFNDDPIYNVAAHVSHHSSTPFHGLAHEPFRVQPVNQTSIKQEDYARPLSDEPLPSAGQPYLNISGGNPLLSQGRGFLDAYDQSTSDQPLTCLGFTPINRDHRKSSVEHDQKPSLFQNKDFRPVKAFYEATNRTDSAEKREPSYHSMGIWTSEAPGDDLGIENDLGSEHIEM